MALFLRTNRFAEDMPEGEGSSSLRRRSAGDALRQQREALGLDLDDIAAALKIKPAYLAALEAGSVERLPGPAYAVGFVRAYGDHLGLDGNEILRRFKEGSSALHAKPDLSFPMPLSKRSIPGVPMLLVALILVLCGYGSWYYLSTGERSRPERVAEVPAALLPPVAERGAAEPANSTPIQASPPTGPAQPANELAAASEATAADSDPGAVSAVAVVHAAPVPAMTAAQPMSLAPVAAAPAPIPAADDALPPRSEGRQVYGAVDGPVRVVIRATAEAWVQIRDADRSILFSRVLKTGESYRAPDRPGVSMRTGNAGGLEITVDGNPAPSIGPYGAVRNVPLEPRALIAGTTGG